MNHAASFLRSRIAAQLAGSDPARAQIVIGGLPEGLLVSLYRQLTADETSAWHTRVGASDTDVPVLFIPADRQHAPALHGPLTSSRCTWDFAVNARSGCKVLVILVSPRRAAEMPESIANATALAGFASAPASGRALRMQLGRLGLPAELAERAATADRATIAAVISGFFDGSVGIPTDERLEGTWLQIDQLLQSTGGAGNFESALLGGFGLPSDDRDLTPARVRELESTLNWLGEFLSEHGLEAGITKLAQTAAAAGAELQQALTEFRTWLFTEASVSSAAAFERSARWYFRQGATAALWWSHLTARVLDAMLAEAGATRRTERVDICVLNALTHVGGPDDQPWVVRDNASMSFSPRGEGSLAGSSVLLGATEIATLQGQAPYTLDVQFPAGDRQEHYTIRVEGPNVRAETARVLSLSRFEPRAFLEFPDALHNPAPAFKDNVWSQAVTLLRGGTTRLQVHLATPAVRAELVVDGQTPHVIADGGHHQMELEAGSVLAVSVLDDAGAAVSRISVTIALESPDGAASRSYFDALVQAHRAGRRLVPPVVLDSGIRRLEDAYRSSASSWKPVLACLGPGSRLDVRDLDWADPKVGNTTTILDARPRQLAPPTSLLQAREEIRIRLASEGRPIPDINLGGPTEYADLAERYLTAYLEWFRASPSDASWFDVVVFHAAVYDQQSGGEVGTTAPTAMLLSPLHPIRFAWQQQAQRLLHESLGDPCPTAGLLASRSAPDAGGWQLGATATTLTAFFSRPCGDAYWSVLWNSAALPDATVTAAAERALEGAGMRIGSVAPGFDASQVRHALREVSGILSARSTLRCGIAGQPGRASALTQGVFDWVEEHFGEDAENSLPNAVEIYDSRDDGAPRDDELGYLSRVAEGRVRWFRGNHTPRPDLPWQDLSIIDQLSVGPARFVPSALRSAIGPGGLTRVRLRIDSDEARRLVETRVAAPLAASATPLDELITAFEARAVLATSSAAAVESQPNQQAIGRRLETAQLVAVTSGQVDLACLTRGIEAQQGFLWDYEIPNILEAEQQVGYYLVARPSDGMRRSIEVAVRLLAGREPTEPEILGVLREVSRRGIPVLKRVSEGGAHARGELGALLAARFLQDVFRPTASRRGLPVSGDGMTTMLMPVDPFESVFSAIGARLAPDVPRRMRPDFLAFCVRREGTRFAVRVTPVEVKYRGGQLSPSDRQRAYDQAKSFADLLRGAVVNPRNRAWELGGSALLAECLDYAFRLHASQEIAGVDPTAWTALHSECLQHVLARSARIEVHPTGVLIAIQGEPTREDDLDDDGVVDGVLLGPADTACLYSLGFPFEQTTAELVERLAIRFTDGYVETTGASGGSSLQPTTPDSPVPALASHAGAPPTDVPPVQAAAVPLSAASPMSAPPSTEQPSAPVAMTSPQPVCGAAGAPAVVRRTVGPTAEVRTQVNAAFEGFVANEEAVLNLKRDALYARMQDPVALTKAFLFTGSASTGKTTLALRFANAIGVPVIKLEGRAPPLQSREGLIEAVNAGLISQGQRPRRRSLGGTRVALDYPPFLLFIDEVHLVPPRVQESLLTMVEANDRSAVIDANRTAHVPLATFVFATTRASQVDGPLRSRCDEISLRDYTTTEVAEITRRQHPDWPQAVHERLAVLGRRVPRISLELARSLDREMLVSGDESRTIEQHLEAVARSKRIDELGLTSFDRQYLTVLHQQRRAVGRELMLNLLATVDKDRVNEEIEPYLSMLQFIRLTGNGREITREGIRYLESHRGEPQR